MNNNLKTHLITISIILVVTALIVGLCTLPRVALQVLAVLLIGGVIYWGIWMVVDNIRNEKDDDWNNEFGR
jgi:hypothetical protein